MATWKSKYFYGNEISQEEIEHGYINYRTLAKCGDAILCNDITKLFYSSINGEYIEPEQVNGYIDNSEEIEYLEEKREEIEDKQIEMIHNDLEESEEYKQLQEEFEKLDEQIQELKDEQDEQPEIYQYYIINDNFASILKEFTNEIIYYIPLLDIYVWGICHYGTAWNGVYTDIKIEL